MKPFFVNGGAVARPAARRAIYCDGSPDSLYRAGIDLELSHWIPNHTPPRYKADTSTGICLDFIEHAPDAEAFDLVVNNHIDVDGMLAVFVLVTGAPALAYRTALVQAATMGDFWGWGEAAAQILFQALTLEKDRLIAENRDPHEIYTRCFALIRRVLAGEPQPAASAGIGALAESVALIDQGTITRTPIDTRLVHYAIPLSLGESEPGRCLHLPSFNEALSRRSLLSPQARARTDAERVQLVSVETSAGSHYDLWFPGYVWADTATLWRPPGVVPTGDVHMQRLRHAPLAAAVAALGALEANPGDWVMADRLSAFEAVHGRGFPVVVSFISNGASAPSSIAPEIVAARLSGIFGGD